MQRTALTLAAGLGLALSAEASDLKLAGQNNAVAVLGGTLPVALTGNPGLPAAVLFDLSQGPVPVGPDLVPLGFTGALFTALAGLTNGAGQLSQTLPIPALPSLLPVSFFGAGVVIDPADPDGLDWSNGTVLTFTNTAVNPTEQNLAGVPRAAYPFFQWAESFRQGDSLRAALDPTAYPALVGQSVDVYVVANRSQAEWSSNPLLVDVSNNGADTFVVSGTGIAANTWVVDNGSLSGEAGAGFGVGYDLVIDVNQNGVLDTGDLIDGFTSGAGLYVCKDPTVAGPYTVLSTTYSGGTFLGQILYYPANIAELSDVPLVVVSHGNGHNYLWYGHIGEHLASYGYVVMSHQNNTVPGVASAATTTLTNTEFLLANLNTIAGGALVGKLDKSRMTWIGHSRGGEGVTIAYDRIVDGVYVPVNFALSDIKLVSSMAPTDFLGPGQSNPHGVNYHLWVAEADNDVNGCANNDIAQPYHLFARATGQRQAITIYGAGHGDLHNGATGSVAAGPCLLGRPTTHGVMRGHILPLVEYNIRQNPAAKDWLTRPYEDLPPQSAPIGTNPCIVVNLQFRDGASVGKLVIDNFENGATVATASSGAPITTDLAAWVVARLDDPNTTFVGTPTDPLNGMTYARSTDTEAGGVLLFDNTNQFLRYTMLASQQNWSGFRSLSLRACQSTRHPLTDAETTPADFTVRVTDLDGVTSSIRLSAFNQGIKEPYQRTGCGTPGAGWANQFETVRFDLAQFRVQQPDLDLSRIDRLEFLFGPAHGSPFGFYGLDDIELTNQ